MHDLVDRPRVRDQGGRHQQPQEVSREVRGRVGSANCHSKGLSELFFTFCTFIQRCLHFALLFRVVYILYFYSELFTFCTFIQSCLHFALLFRGVYILHFYSELFSFCTFIQRCLHFVLLFRVVYILHFYLSIFHLFFHFLYTRSTLDFGVIVVAFDLKSHILIWNMVVKIWPQTEWVKFAHQRRLFQLSMILSGRRPSILGGIYSNTTSPWPICIMDRVFSEKEKSFHEIFFATILLYFRISFPRKKCEIFGKVSL